MAITSYDVVEYPSLPLAQTHPDRLAAIAIMYGLSPAAPDRCRVLELGGGDGPERIGPGIVQIEDDERRRAVAHLRQRGR